MAGFVAICILGLGAIFGLAFWADSASCHSKWQSSGFQTQWGPVKGCLISKDGKTFIPSDNYREIAD